MSEDHRQRLRQALLAGEASGTPEPTGTAAPMGTPPAAPALLAPQSAPAGAPATRPRRAVVATVATALAVVTVGAVGFAVSRQSGAVPDAYPGDAAPAASYELPQQRNVRVVQAMVDRRTAALRAGDEAGWLAGLDPTATKLVDHERMRFRNLRQLRPASFAMRSEYPNVDYKAPTSAPVDGTVAVTQTMRLAEDAQLSKNTYRWKVRIDGEQVTLTGVEPTTGELTDEGASENPPWDDVPLRSARGKGVTVLSAANSKWNPRAYLPGGQRAARMVKSLWGKRLGAPGFVVFLADERQFNTWFGVGTQRPGVIGLAVFPDMVNEDGGPKMIRPNPNKVGHPASDPAWLERNAGARIVLRMSKITGTAKAEHVIAHEIAHAVGPHLIQTANLDYGDDGGLNQPTWAIEGFARWVEHLSDPGSAARGMRYVRANRAKYGPRGGGLPVNKNFYSKDNGRTHFNYELASSLFLAAAKVGGRQKAVDLYIALSNQMSMLSDDTLFIDISLSGVGLNPGRVWAEHRRLVG